jgi:hypothetical protein
MPFCALPVIPYNLAQKRYDGLTIWIPSNTFFCFCHLRNSRIKWTTSKWRSFCATRIRVSHGLGSTLLKPFSPLLSSF